MVAQSKFDQEKAGKQEAKINNGERIHHCKPHRPEVCVVRNWGRSEGYES